MGNFTRIGIDAVLDGCIVIHFSTYSIPTTLGVLFKSACRLTMNMLTAHVLI